MNYPYYQIIRAKNYEKALTVHVYIHACRERVEGYTLTNASPLCIHVYVRWKKFYIV